LHKHSRRLSKMDLNYLLYRQQIERSMSKAASSSAARKIHDEFARAYEDRIHQYTGGRIFLRTNQRG
jgi:hypothetical protein